MVEVWVLVGGILYLVALSTLGKFTGYRCVYYRVYVKKDKSKSQREPLIVVTNFGPLAIISANLHYLKQSNYSNPKFFLGILIPITLATVINSPQTLNLIKKPEELINQLMKELSEKTKVCEEACKEEIREKENMRKVMITSLELELDSYGEHKNEEVKLPVINFMKAKIIIKNLSESREKEEFNGVLGVALVPLTGSFKNKNGKLIIFREKSGSDIEYFGEAFEATYLIAIKKLISNFLSEYVNQGGNSVKFIVDTTHGLNNATTAMTRVLEDALPLIKYEVLKKNFTNFEILYYNSDPALNLGKSDSDSLKNTYDANISYYYMIKREKPLSHVVDNVKELVMRGGELSNNLLEILQGIYLIRFGLIPWGLYNVEFAKNVSDVSNFVKITSEKEGMVSYECVGRNKNYYLRALAEWLAGLAKESVTELIRELESNVESEVSIKDICWSSSFKPSDVRCYPLKWLKNLVKNYEKSSWAKKFLNDVIEVVGKLIFMYEIEEWINNPLFRIRYQLPPIFNLREHISSKKLCSEILGEPEKNGYYCITPMKIQKEIRNVVAHAGLTGVHRGTAFIFRDKEGGKCECYAICIASKFPFNQLTKELK